jgi:DoxX-like family
MIYFQIITVAIEVLLVFAIGGVLIYTAMRPAAPAPTSLRQRVGDVLIYLAVFIFVASGVTKLLHFPPAVTEMGLLGLTGSSYLVVASIEITSGILLLIRPMRSFALLFNSAHVGGAICAHLIAGQYFAMVPSAIVLSLCWLGAFLRHPQVLWSLTEARIPLAKGRGRRVPPEHKELSALSAQSQQNPLTVPVSGQQPV